MKTFYLEGNSKKQISEYRLLLGMMASLSGLFSDNIKPFINSRVAENLFCKCFNAENLSRSDITADAKKENVGFGIKTWIDSNLQKVAEFNKTSNLYRNLKGEKFVEKIIELRNDRIDFTVRSQNLSNMFYHCVCRDINKIIIFEEPLLKINLGKIRRITESEKTINFEDDVNRYSFNKSKSTLYKYFDKMQKVDEFDVTIIENPYDLLREKLIGSESTNAYESDVIIGTVYLPLYSYTKKDGKVVNEKSGLNQRFANGRRRDPYEVYIPIPKEFRDREKEFFPSIDEIFELHLPDGRVLSAKICQENGKALMSNPNKDLGKWLIDDIFRIGTSKPITYKTLEKYGIDSVILEKHWLVDKSKRYYTINFASLGSYERFIGREQEVDLDD